MLGTVKLTTGNYFQHPHTIHYCHCCFTSRPDKRKGCDRTKNPTSEPQLGQVVRCREWLYAKALSIFNVRRKDCCMKTLSSIASQLSPLLEIGLRCYLWLLVWRISDVLLIKNGDVLPVETCATYPIKTGHEKWVKALHQMPPTVLQWREFHIVHDNWRWAESKRRLIYSIIYTTDVNTTLFFKLELCKADARARIAVQSTQSNNWKSCVLAFYKGEWEHIGGSPTDHTGRFEI